MRVFLILLICLLPSLAMAKPFVIVCTMNSKQSPDFRWDRLSDLEFRIDPMKENVERMDSHGGYHPMKVTAFNEAAIVAEDKDATSKDFTFHFNRYSGQLSFWDSSGKETIFIYYSCEKVTKRKF